MSGNQPRGCQRQSVGGRGAQFSQTPQGPRGRSRGVAWNRLVAEGVAALSQAPPPPLSTSPGRGPWSTLPDCSSPGGGHLRLPGEPLCRALATEKFLRGAFSADCHPGESAPLCPWLINPPTEELSPVPAMPARDMTHAQTSCLLGPCEHVANRVRGKCHPTHS